MIVRTEAVVLRSMKYGETSRIATLFTREKGKISVLAKGARLTKSRFGSTLQPLSYTQVVFYYKPTRSLQTLSDSAHVQPFYRIARDLERIAIGLRIVELVGALLHEEEQNPLVFNLLLQSLHRLDDAEVRFANVLPYFQLRLAAALGFFAGFDRETVQNLPPEGGVLLLDSGQVAPGQAPTGSARAGSRAALRAFAICARADLDTVLRMRLEADVYRELEALVEDYLRFHVGDSYPSRTSKVIHQIRDDSLG